MVACDGLPIIRRLKMAGCRRSEIQVVAYDGLPIIRSPEGRRWLDAEDWKYRWRQKSEFQSNSFPRKNDAQKSCHEPINSKSDNS